MCVTVHLNYMIMGKIDEAPAAYPFSTATNVGTTTCAVPFIIMDQPFSTLIIYKLSHSFLNFMIIMHSIY